MAFIGDILISFIFLISGLVFLYLILTKYTEEAHKRELKKNKWMKNDYYNYENPIFFRIMSNSYIIAKIVLILCATTFTFVGIFLFCLKVKEGI